MKLMVIGGGGREHAIIRKLKENPAVETIYALPGNGGIAGDAVCVPIKAIDLQGICDFALKEKIDFAVVAPDDPLCMGLCDRLSEIGVPSFGPSAKAARIEGSKAFAKELMRRYGIPTADFKVFNQADQALQHIRQADYPLVIKCDGLALGKGVLICADPAQAEEAIQSLMVEKRFGESGTTLVIEEFLTGPEVSVLGLTDGKTLRVLASSMDHKRAFDGDKGPNTGGMGVIAPNPFYSREIAERCEREIFFPTLEALAKEGCPFKGCLYFGLMLSPKGPKVIEYNCRFGDPETQALLPLLKSDLLELMISVSEERLHEMDLEMEPASCCCLILASGGYPDAYQTGYPISGLKEAEKQAIVYHAGTRIEEGQYLTNGGRVLGISCVKPDLSQAVRACYEAAEQVQFEQMHFRRDIGSGALSAFNQSMGRE